MTFKTLALVAALFATQSAFATTYVGAGIGQSRLHSKDLNQVDGLHGVSIDKKDRAGKVFVGKELNRNIALEASYFDLGDFSASYAGREVASVGARGIGLDLVGKLPLTENLSVLGRVGVNRTRIDGEIVGYGRDHKNTTQPKAGLGLQYNLTDNLALRGEYEAYRTNATYAGYKEKSHVNVVGASLVYKFGAAPKVVKTTYAAPAPVYTPAPAPVAEAPAPVTETTVVKKKVRE